jgi:hypothetical protein
MAVSNTHVGGASLRWVPSVGSVASGRIERPNCQGDRTEQRQDHGQRNAGALTGVRTSLRSDEQGADAEWEPRQSRRDSDRLALRSSLREQRSATGTQMAGRQVAAYPGPRTGSAWTIRRVLCCV